MDIGDWPDEPDGRDWMDGGSTDLNEELADAEFDREVALRGLEVMMVEDLARNLGKPDVTEVIECLGPYERGDPALNDLLNQLRALKRDGTLSDAGYFHVVAVLMESMECNAADGDPEVTEMLAWIRANRVPESPGDEPDWEDVRQSVEYQKVSAEWSWRCHLAWTAWLRELGEYEMAWLAEVDPGAYERKRIAGEGHVCGCTRITLNRCPENDGVRGYRDPWC